MIVLFEYLVAFLIILFLLQLSVNYAISDSYGSNPVAVAVRNYYYLTSYFGTLVLIITICLLLWILNIYPDFVIKIIAISIIIGVVSYYRLISKMFY